MAIPRIFVSSTCYDLQEIRFQLRDFIKGFGYEPVMSEFDGIFYNYESHVQDSCLAEISKCQLFLLVVGNNYGSFYHQQKENIKTPDSVTLQEFKKAIENDVYKHVFINKFVDYDYGNYQRALKKIILKHFKDNEIENEKIASVKLQLKQKFDETYPFPYDSYQYVFYFLDIIHELKNGNAYNTFESFADVKESLKKQWAGFMYENLTKKTINSHEILAPINERITHIDDSLKKLLNTKTISQDSKISFDISKISRDVDIDSLEELQNQIYDTLENIFLYGYYDHDGELLYNKRVWFNFKITHKKAKEWLDSLETVGKDYKWSKTIHANDVYKAVPFSKWIPTQAEIAYVHVFTLFSIYDSLADNEKDSFIKTVMKKFDEAYEAPVPDKDEPLL
jgi:hypothetical protein